MVILLLSFKKDKTNDNILADPSPTPSNQISEESYMPYDDFNIVVTSFVIKDNDELVLIPNYSENLESKEVRETYGCKNAVNAGFYTEDREPIGLIVSSGNLVSEFQNNKTLNGVLSINDKGQNQISYQRPTDPYIAVQAGPIVIYDAKPVDLQLSSDFYARRIVAAVDAGGDLHFFVVYNPKSVMQGPLLEDLGRLINDYANVNGIKIEKAINLDGGAASVFYSDDVKLLELVRVGSIFCVR